MNDKKPFVAKKLFIKKTKEKPRVEPTVLEEPKEEEVFEVQVGSLINHAVYGAGIVLRYKDANTVACDFKGSLRSLSVSEVETLLTPKEVEEITLATGFDPKEDNSGKA